ncbi:hypothetical protein LTR74_000218 [Friedmanniomyces endolithicus]|nr:hypothetical protein LTR74_000218 [Friedmanniomyces endolithicus]
MSSYTNDGGASAAQNTNAMDPVGMNSETAEAARQKSAEVMAALKEGKPGEADEIMGKPDDSKGPSVIDRVKRKIGVGGDKKGEGDVFLMSIPRRHCIANFLATPLIFAEVPSAKCKSHLPNQHGPRRSSPAHRGYRRKRRALGDRRAHFWVVWAAFEAGPADKAVWREAEDCKHRSRRLERTESDRHCFTSVVVAMRDGHGGEADRWTGVGGQSVINLGLSDEVLVGVSDFRLLLL